MKTLSFAIVVFGFAAASASASTAFTLTQTPDATFNNVTTHLEQTWDFTGQTGWNQNLIIDSVEVTETFSNIGSTANFQSTIIGYSNNPGTGSAIYFLFNAGKPTASEDVTETAPYPCCGDGHGHTFTVADITGNSELGLFQTRVSNNNGGGGTNSHFTLDSITVTITADQVTPEPATFAAMGLGLGALGFLNRRSRVKGR